MSADPLVIAHRGFSAEYPENTLAAFRAALGLGVDGCECDVHLSRDGVPFLLHDDNLKRTTGVDEVAGTLDWESIRRLDAGSWKDARFAGEPPPMLAEALAAHEGRGELVIELKPRGDAAHVAERVLEAVHEDGAVDRCTIISFGLEFAVEAARCEPRVPCLWLLSKVPEGEAERQALLSEALAAGMQGINLQHGAVDAAIVRMAHRRALAVWCWTVNDEAAADRVVAADIDAITTDRPDWLKQRLAAMP